MNHSIKQTHSHYPRKIGLNQFLANIFTLFFVNFLNTRYATVLQALN